MSFYFPEEMSFDVGFSAVFCRLFLRTKGFLDVLSGLQQYAFFCWSFGLFQVLPSQA